MWDLYQFTFHVSSVELLFNEGNELRRPRNVHPMFWVKKSNRQPMAYQLQTFDCPFFGSEQPLLFSLNIEKYNKEYRICGLTLKKDC